MNLRTKFLVVFLSVILICGFTVIVLVKNIMSESIMNEFETKGTTIARNLAVQSEDLILTENTLQLLRLITNTKNSEHEVQYIFITSPDNKVIVHTFKEGFPTNLLNANRLINNSSENIVSLKSENGIILDFAYPVMNGEIATVRLGMSPDHITKLINDTIFQTIEIILLIMVSGIIIAFVISEYMVRPVIELKNAASEIGLGHLDTQISVKSNDEIGELGLAFNKMAEDLKRSNEKIISEKEYTDNIVYCITESLIVVSPGGIIQTTNDSTTSLLEYGKEELIGQPISRVLLNGEQFVLDIMKGKEATKTNSSYHMDMTFISKSSRKIPIILSGSVMFDKSRNITGILCVSQDITERKIAQDNMKKSLQEKEVLLREIHHRVKNNMQIISSLLYLQMEAVKDTRLSQALMESQNRITSMALIHEKLYQSSDLMLINFKEYINDLAVGLFQAYGVNMGIIKLNINIEDTSMDIDHAIPAGLIINELITNSLKYAFPEGRKGIIYIILKTMKDNMVELVIGDNGIGLPRDFDFKKSKTLGLHLVTTLVENQLNGKINIHNNNGGTEFAIQFRGMK